MDAQEFTMPSPKRQRTESPHPTFEATQAPSAPDEPSQPQTAITQEAEMKPPADEPERAATIPGLGLLGAQSAPQLAEAQVTTPQSNGFLDALMIHVESISQPETGDVLSAHSLEASEPVAAIQTKTLQYSLEPATTTEPIRTKADVGTADQTIPGSDQSPMEQPILAPVPLDTNREDSVTARQHATNTEDTFAADQDHTMSVDPQQAEDGIANAEGAEWEVDSSPYVSSDSDDSSDTSSEDSDDDDADGDYAMLDPEEQARILMAGDGGSDDEGDKKGKTSDGQLRTAHEKIEEVIPKPDIVVTDEMEIEELGAVEGVVENTVLVKATVSGEYQVLESNSLLCLEDRSVVGVVAEPLGRVEQPMYTIRFTNDETIKEAGLSEKGTKVFYVPKHSTFVFTQPLKAVKGSDASNFHDEEVGDDEMEFSDDEAEAEHKKQLKMRKQSRRDEQGGGRGRGRGGRGNYQRGRHEFRAPSSEIGSIYGNGPAEISYDDVPEGDDEGYTPLARPANLNEMMAGVQREPLEGSHHAGGYSNRGYDPSSSRGRGRGRGRGDRDRRGVRGGRGGGGSQPSWTSYQGSSDSQSNGYSQKSPQSMLPPQFPYQQQPNQPRLSPQTQQTPFLPSPISPLPGNNFNFNFQQQNQQWPGVQSYQQQQGQIPQTGYQANSSYGTQQYGQNQPQGPFNMNSWNANQAAAAQVAAQLEQFRKSQGQ